jgi:hypothetical protein
VPHLAANLTRAFGRELPRRGWTCTRRGAASSTASGVSNGQQAGSANFGGVDHAGIWSGSAASWVDLHPAGATTSAVYGVSGGRQAGFARIGGSDHASLWNGTASSWIDLHAFAPAGFSSSSAVSIWSDASVIHVAGFGYNAQTGRTEALLWTRPNCYANCDASSIAPILNVNDFTCFLNHFAANNSSANCDSSTTTPVLNVNDFTCFLNRYAAGCP